MFSGLPVTTLLPLRRAINAAVCLVAGLVRCDPVTVAMRELHGLLISFHIKHKLGLQMHAAVKGFYREYISKVLVAFSVLPGRAVMRYSRSGAFDVPHTRMEFGWRAFSVPGPAAWKSLPQSLRKITDIG